MSQEKRRRVFLVDGNSFLYRAYYATPYLATSKGLPTNATYAMTNMILKLIKEKKPDSLFVIFDSKIPSFRHEISKEYKAQRKPMPDNLSVQIPYVKSVIDALGIPIIEVEGYEADDVIGTIVEKLRGEDIEIYIVTGDKDLMQFITKNVYVYDTMRDVLYGEKEVEEKFGISPSMICDFLALSGDTSDNIPGIPGIGEKTAQMLIREFGNIDNIYARINEIKKESLKEKLKKGMELALLSKTLAKVKSDVPIGDIKLKWELKPDLRKLKNIFRELEFTSLYREIRIDNQEKVTWNEVKIENIDPRNISIVASFDRKQHPFPVFINFAVFDGRSVAYSEKKDDLSRLLSEARDVTFHNIKEFFLSGLNINLDRAFDVMLCAYLLNPLRKDLTLDAIVEEYLSTEVEATSEKRGLFERSKWLYEVKNVLFRKMEEMNLKWLFYNVEMPLTEVLSEMEKTGVKVDKKKLLQFSQELGIRLKDISRRIYEISGQEFNINSSQQLSNILFNKLKLRPVKKTKTGFSTDTEVLEELANEHPIVPLILEYRTLTKLKNTYIDTLPQWINPLTGRIHTSFNQMNVATGRLSTSDPNLQNIPVRGEEGKRIREAFIAEDGYLLMSSDYSQIELRILAHLSKDEALIEAFRRGEDIHNNVAMEFFKVDKDKITPEMRRVAKVVNFGVIYGISAYGLSKELRISQKEAQKYIDDYFSLHKGVKDYMDRIVKEAEERGFVRTYYGRIRYIPELYNPDQKIKQLGIRTAMNTPIQGTAADIIKMAMVNIFRKKKDLNLSSKLILQIHDELLFEVKGEEKDLMEHLVKEEMENVVKLDVPLKVSIGFGKNWAEAKD
ncbi:MAG: DNA polymerase I [Deltaproteobacteria bacterium]|nr:DNA polymerase I [Deltaproteobacteria bacterium]